jgi:lipopolysaccharide export system permease protein
VRILDRHVLRECGVASALATSAFIFVLVAGNVAQQVIGAVSAGRVDVWQALEMVGLLFPTVIPYALPMGVLTGVLLTFGRMGAEGEITAMKAAGLSLRRIAMPVWIAVVFLAAVSAWLNLEAGPESEDGFQRILVGAASGNPAGLIIPGKLNRQFKGLLIRAEEKDGDVLKEFRLWQVDEKGIIRQSLYATEARLAATFDAKGAAVLRVRLTRAKLTTRDPHDDLDMQPGSFSSANEATLDFPRDDSGRIAYVKRLRMMTAGELVAAMKTGWQLPPDAPVADKAREVMQLKVQLMFRVATALSVFSLALLAVPLAVSVGRAETNVNAALALGVALSYYLMTSMASWVKVPTMHPEILVLLPNFVVMGIAWWLLHRSGRN